MPPRCRRPIVCPAAPTQLPSTPPTPRCACPPSPAPQMDPDVLGVLVEGLGPGATLAAPDGTGSVSTLGALPWAGRCCCCSCCLPACHRRPLQAALLTAMVATRPGCCRHHLPADLPHARRGVCGHGEGSGSTCLRLPLAAACRPACWPPPRACQRRPSAPPPAPAPTISAPTPQTAPCSPPLTHTHPAGQRAAVPPGRPPADGRRFPCPRRQQA